MSDRYNCGVQCMSAATRLPNGFRSANKDCWFNPSKSDTVEKCHWQLTTNINIWGNRSTSVSIIVTALNPVIRCCFTEAMANDYNLC